MYGHVAGLFAGTTKIHKFDIRGSKENVTAVWFVGGLSAPFSFPITRVDSKQERTALKNALM